MKRSMPPRCSTTARLGCALVLCSAASLAIAEITTGPPSPAGLPPVDPGIRLTVAGTDAAATRSFRRYWRLVYPGSAAIRLAWLRAIRQRAEAGA